MVIIKKGESSEARPLIPANPKRCFYCSEIATTEDSNGVPLCGIPGNHDSEEEIVLN